MHDNFTELHKLIFHVICNACVIFYSLFQMILTGVHIFNFKIIFVMAKIYYIYKKISCMCSVEIILTEFCVIICSYVYSLIQQFSAKVMQPRKLHQISHTFDATCMQTVFAIYSYTYRDACRNVPISRPSIVSQRPRLYTIN